MDRIRTTIPGCPRCKGHSVETRISKCVTNIVRHHDQDEREADGAMHWNVILPVLKGRFQNQLVKEFTDEDWLHCLYLGSFKTRFEICKDENGELRFFRAIQGEELRNDPYRWRQFISTWVERETNSVAKLDWWQEERERKEGRQAIFFTPLDPFNSDADEAELITVIKKPRKVHYQIHWRPEQDAVSWTHLSTAQDAGLEFWQTGSNVIITYQSVRKECVVQVVSESGKSELFA